MPSTTDGRRSERLVEELRAEFPAFSIRPKHESALQRAIDVALKVITLGAQRSYLTRYHTVLGSTLWVPTLWDTEDDAARYVLLRHERVHLRQRRRYGAVGMALLYLLPILPLGLALGRARLELEAYAETLRATAEVHGLPAARDPRTLDEIVRRFTSGDYGWMWPFPATVRRWLLAILDRIEHDQGARAPDARLD
ncbi:MAG: hypothetical protein NVSMB47_14580 [Polyangiales bacterium]